MKILFLDFDGVLNSKQQAIWHRRRPGARERFGRPLARLVGYAIDFLFKFQVFPRLRARWTEFYLLHLTDHCSFCPIACSNVQYILDEVPDAYIVVSSVWRSWGLKNLRKILARNGIDPTRVVGRTGAWEDGGDQRGDQIKAWLDRHEQVVTWCQWRAGPWYGIDEAPFEVVQAFAVLDDDSDMVAVRANFVKTDYHLGCTVRDAERVIELLDPAKKAEGSA